ncbi:hypothetical protein [Brevundimonas sp.]|uniref:hypothetical protein n=1 Tax=Brevundimonas sp. TaxID=1871086 RepID=UPI00286AECA0|nr:hypothetical protein [Brevundimonas sp.]
MKSLRSIGLMAVALLACSAVAHAAPVTAAMTHLTSSIDPGAIMASLAVVGAVAAAPTEGIADPNPATGPVSVLQALHDSEINAGIQTFFDGQFEVWLGDEANGRKAETIADSYASAEAWLTMAARERYPDSQFAQANPG